jgi:hypothetical protein
MAWLEAVGVLLEDVCVSAMDAFKAAAKSVWKARSFMLSKKDAKSLKGMKSAKPRAPLLVRGV